MFDTGRLTIGPPFGGHVLLLDQKNLSTEDAKKWPNILLFGIMNSENMSNHFPTKNYTRSFSANYVPADVMTFFLVFTCFWAEKWTPADMDDPQRTCPLSRSENMVTLDTGIVKLHLHKN